MATAKQKKAAANRMKAAAKIMKSKTATKAEKASAKRKRDAANKIRTSKTTVKKAIVGKAKKERDKDTSDSKTKTKTTAKGPFFFGTNIPLSAVADSGKRDEINARLKTDIAAGDWSGANDALFSAAFNTVKGGKGHGNPNVGKVHSGEWKVNKSPISWAETAIDSSNDYYPQVDGSVVTWDDNLGALKDGVSVGSWGGQAKGENQPRSGQAPPKAGVKGAAPINVDTSGKQSALRQRGLRDINTIFGAGTTGGTGGGRGGFAGDTSGGLLGGQYGGRVGEYQVPNRSFNWQTDPTEQALMASAMGRPDLAQMMLTGQYGPLAGQNYQYGGGQTRINYGGAGAGAGAGLGGAGAGGTGGRLGPLGGAGADTAAAAVVNPDVARQDWWPPGATNARMAAWMRDTGGTPLEWTESLPKLGESLAGLRGLFGLGGREAATTTPGYTGPGSKWADYGSPMGFEDVKARAARTPSVSPPSGYPDFASGALSPTRNIRSGMALTTPEVGTGVNDITPWGLSSLGYPDYAGGAITPTTPVQVGMGTGYAPTTTLDRFINPARSSGITPFEATGGAPVYGSLGSLGVTPFESTGGADVMFGTPYTGGTGFRR